MLPAAPLLYERHVHARQQLSSLSTFTRPNSFGCVLYYNRLSHRGQLGQKYRTPHSNSMHRHRFALVRQPVYSTLSTVRISGAVIALHVVPLSPPQPHIGSSAIAYANRISKRSCCSAPSGYSFTTSSWLELTSSHVFALRSLVRCPAAGRLWASSTCTILVRGFHQQNPADVLSTPSVHATKYEVLLVRPAAAVCEPSAVGLAEFRLPRQVPPGASTSRPRTHDGWCTHAMASMMAFLGQFLAT